MNHTDDDLQQLAGEYVLGTLPAPQRREIEQRMTYDATLRDAVAQWEARLHPLTSIPAEQPLPTTLWARIANSIQPASRSLDSGWQRWWNDLRLWRLTTAGSFAAALLLGILVLARPVVQEPKFMVVLVDPQGQTPGWIVQAKLEGQISLVPLGQERVPANKALQFWTKGDNWKGPVSLGLVKPGQTAQIPLDHLPPMQPNQLFEITLEPESGSPIGRPTGPILYIGRAVKMT
ncbi:anti-sigma factor [uncultured Oxalicibacterium sp.]|uniref:anti-sigma factor n=1 Tax=uncultured Oxalicibacterium sp. TaxID=1168540 RepID=UPI0025F3CEEC|nr:anti-sigma factor [uncultured Oxalicibacterium sp.]